MAAHDLTAQRLREALHYDPDTGVFTWRPLVLSQKRTTRRAGRRAGWQTALGYVYIGIDGAQYGAHRLAWLYQAGAWPEQDVDHINGRRADNRWANLRDVAHRMNVENQRAAPSSNQSTRLLGVTFHKPSGLYLSQIKSKGKKHYLGYFKTPEPAHEAYLAAKRRLHEGCTI